MDDEVFLKRIESQNKEALETTKRLLVKSFRDGYDAAIKDNPSRVVMLLRCAGKGGKHAFRVNRNGVVICRKCGEEFVCVDSKSIEKANIIFL